MSEHREVRAMSHLGETHIPHLVAQSRRAQGLPDHVEDPAALALVATLLRAAAERQTPEGGRRTAGQAAAS